MKKFMKCGTYPGSLLYFLPNFSKDPTFLSKQHVTETLPFCRILIANLSPFSDFFESSCFRTLFSKKTYLYKLLGLREILILQSTLSVTRFLFFDDFSDEILKPRRKSGISCDNCQVSNSLQNAAKVCGITKSTIRNIIVAVKARKQKSFRVFRIPILST